MTFSGALSAETYIVKGEDGRPWPARKFAISPEPDRLACLGDWDPDSGLSPLEFYARYLQRRDPQWIARGGSVPIFWSVVMEGNGSWLSPFPHPDFPDAGTWSEQGWSTPVCAETGRPIDWFRLPIVHRFPEFWNQLGFDPAPFQRRLDLQDVLWARLRISVGGNGAEKSPNRPRN